ncbi:MAG: site-2 protease family protein [Clostridia bacterium]|nr:site-2 protease family protein [Clostridia bacterium]
MSFLYILAAILMLGLMVTVHEAGHFLAARLTGIPVKEFAIGFGPKILTWNSKKHETKFCLRVIPAGGYCMFYGEDDTEGKEAKNDPRAIGNYAVWRRLITILLGPVMNFVLAFAVATALYAAVGEDTAGVYGYPVVLSVESGSPAQEAGLKKNDRLLSVNGEDASGVSDDGTMLKISALIDRYGEGGAPLALIAQRGEDRVSVSVQPKFDAEAGRYLMGVTLNTGYTPGYTAISLPRAAQLSAQYCVRAGGAILGSLRDLVTTGKGFEESSGPIGIVKLIAEETQRSAEESAREALLTYGELLVLISVNLGLFNLLPIPGLDGSRVIFLLIEAVRRKPVPQKVEAYVHLSGYILLMGLMLLITFKDVWNIFG